MAGTAVAGKLSRISEVAPEDGRTPLNCAERSSRVDFALAGEGDDAEIRRLLRENPMRGRIAVSLEREPSFFAEAKLSRSEPDHLTIIARKASRLVCVGSCSFRQRFVNREPRRVGYLGVLRLDAAYEGRFDIIRRGYQFFRDLLDEHAADVFFTSIAADNERAIRFLERGLPGMPRYEYITDFITLLIPVPRRVRSCPCPSAEILQIANAGELVAHLNEHGSAYQFAPYWTAEELLALDALGLRLDDFRVLRNGRRIIGSIALWDQRSFKQTVIREYAKPLAYFRPIINLAARLTGTPRLPPVGTSLAYASVSHLTVAPGEPEVLIALIQELFPRALEKGLDFLALGFAAGDPRLAAIRNHFAPREYRSRLYGVRRPEISVTVESLDRLLVFPELAFL